MTDQADPEQIPAPAVAEEIRPSSFYKCLPQAFVFPFRNRGWAMIVAGSGVFTAAEFVIRYNVMFFGFIALVAMQGYLCAFLFKLIGEAANGDDSPGDWPSLTDPQDDLIKPLSLMIATIAIASAPLLIYAASCAMTEQEAGTISSVVLGGAAALYLPMGLIAVALYGSSAGLNPVRVAVGILRTLPACLVAAGAFLVIYALSAFIQWNISSQALFGISPLAWAVSIYFSMVAMFILGRLYQTHAKRLGWFE